MKLIVSEFARDEIAGVARWYNSKPGRYGGAFLDEIEKAIEIIAANPRLCSPAEDGRDGCEDREYLIKRFKQRVVFTIQNEVITILSVIHSTRRPGSWYLRPKDPVDPPHAPQ